MDDPVSIVLYLVTALAGGMYPLGFIFGGCSACCQGCPEECSRCNRAFSGDGGDGQCYDISGNFQLRIVGGTTVNGTFQNGFSNRNTSSLVVPFTCEESSFEGFGPPVVWSFRLEVQPDDADLQRSSDECNCASCCDLNPRVRLYFYHISGITSGRDRNFYLEERTQFSYLGDDTNSISMALCECSEEGVADTLSLQAYASLLAERFSSECRSLIQDWFSEQSLELVISDVDPCECGACCITGNCESNQTEFYCQDNGTWFDEKNDRAGVWQGVGTDCDPNPCPQPE